MVNTGWDTKIRSLLFGFFLFPEICSNVKRGAVTEQISETWSIKKSHTKVPDFDIPPSDSVNHGMADK